jgi:regulatory protein YycI of two-component signal transduction system YycFG
MKGAIVLPKDIFNTPQQVRYALSASIKIVGYEELWTNHQARVQCKIKLMENREALKSLVQDQQQALEYENGAFSRKS